MKFTEPMRKSIISSPLVLKALKQEAEYNARIDAWETQFAGWLAHEIGYKHEDFKELIKIKPSKKTWKTLGLSPFPEEAYEKISAKSLLKQLK